MQRLLALVVALSLVATFGWAQSPGKITGVVTDETGAPLPGVEVVLHALGAPRTARTDAQGVFHFYGVPPGDHRLEARLTGFSTSEADVSVSSGQLTQLKMVLRIGSLEETITVGRARPREHTAAKAKTPPPPLAFAARAAPVPPPFANTESYRRVEESAFVSPLDRPLSTVSIDVDTASYANVRRFLRGERRLPPPEAVRIEEMLNYFRYSNPPPRADRPLAVSTEVADCPWADGHLLVRVALQAKRLRAEATPPRNLVFLVDVSGSMNSPDKLPLVKAGLRLLADQLTENDRVAIVVYAGASGLVLPPTAGDQRGEILAALDRLQAGGSTNGGAGIHLAYAVARDAFIENGVNRVVLATDGDFNVGVTSEGDLARLVEEKRKSGVFLSVLGFGTGNLKDSTMEMLADRGDGNFAYVDTLDEARKVLVAEADATLITVARDVKMQVEWNPARVARYRLIGYENRMLKDEDFEKDAVDAGEAGAGHSVTFLYEAVPVGHEDAGARGRRLRYQSARRATAAGQSDELLSVKVRYKPAEGGASQELDEPLFVRDEVGDGSADLRFGAAVAAFGMLLRGSAEKGSADYAMVTRLARDGQVRGDAARGEFLELVGLARTLTESTAAQVRR